MLTPQEVRRQFDAIAEEILQSPGIYSELYTRLFSQRVREWIQRASQDEARVIRRVADFDPDYCAEAEPVDAGSTHAAVPPYLRNAGALFNPAWDVQY